MSSVGLRAGMKTWPIPRGLIANNLVTTSRALLLAGVLLIFFELRQTRLDVASELSSVPEMLGTNSIAPLTFDDRQAAERTVQALRVMRRIAVAGIAIPAGSWFAKPPTFYERDVSAEVASATAPDSGYGLPAVALLESSANHLPQVLTDYEIGHRPQASSRFSFDIAAFYDAYDLSEKQVAALGRPLVLHLSTRTMRGVSRYSRPIGIKIRTPTADSGVERRESMLILSTNELPVQELLGVRFLAAAPSALSSYGRRREPIDWHGEA